MYAAALLAAAVGVAAAPMPDKAYRDALDLLYDGSTDTAIERLAAVSESHPDDPLGAYLQALALSWKIEQRPESNDLDRELHRRLDAILTATAARLRAAPQDTRARLARGGAYGLRSRFYLFREKAREAAKAAEAMRAALLDLQGGGEAGDAAFGLGLYDYYVDVLPRAAKLFRFLSGMPGGHRERGVAAITRAKESAVFHRVEAAWQLYEIYAYYEDKPDLGWAQIRRLHDDYPGSALWALKLTEHERERLGRYAEAAAVAREIVRAAGGGEENYGAVAGALGRLALGEALMLDLRLPEARRALLWFKDGFEPAPWLAFRARWLLGRTLELDGDREAALVHYRAAAASSEKDVRARAEKAARNPLPEEQVKAVPLLGDARRAREAGRAAAALDAYRAALDEWPACAEARVRVAEHELRRGRADAGRAQVAELEEVKAPDPPWVRPWTRLLRAWLHDLDGQRPQALSLYKMVLEEPYRDEPLAREARLRLRQPFRRDTSAESGGTPR